MRLGLVSRATLELVELFASGLLSNCTLLNLEDIEADSLGQGAALSSSNHISFLDANKAG